MELADIPQLAAQLNGRAESAPRYPPVLVELTPAQIKQCGEQFIADTRFTARTKHFLSTRCQNNFRHIRLIHLMLPNAKIIDARREPVPCCFSNFRQLLAADQEFTCGLKDIAPHCVQSAARSTSIYKCAMAFPEICRSKCPDRP